MSNQAETDNHREEEGEDDEDVIVEVLGECGTKLLWAEANPYASDQGTVSPAPPHRLLVENFWWAAFG